MVKLEGCHRKRSARLTQIGVFVLALGGLGMVPAKALLRATNLAALGAVARAHHTPIVLLFWSPTCRYCGVVERDFVEPDRHEPRFRSIIFRRVNIDSDKRLVDFAGHVTTEARFAKRFHVRLVPDIKFFNGQGRIVAPEMLGLSTPSFYESYLDSALQTAQRACQKP
ncbi:MAG TPA: thioredoxin fold domain-containing protein [Acidiferrobacter sp.]|nr:thioredoxin fold domain-containing protein [Acidiferrobacter sp.]